jgi:hypothetical protein
LREASYFLGRLSSEDMPLAGLVLNRVHRTTDPPDGTPLLTARRAEVAAEALAALGGQDAALGGQDAALGETALRVHVEIALSAEHDSRLARRFGAAHPSVPVVAVPALPTDVHDLDGLRRIGELLAS